MLKIPRDRELFGPRTRRFDINSISSIFNLNRLALSKFKESVIAYNVYTCKIYVAYDRIFAVIVATILVFVFVIMISTSPM